MAENQRMNEWLEHGQILPDWVHHSLMQPYMRNLQTLQARGIGVGLANESEERLCGWWNLFSNSPPSRSP